MGIGEGRAGLWIPGCRRYGLRACKVNFVLVFRVPEGRLLRAVKPARGGGDIRWLAQNYTGRKIHTATKQDQLKIGFRQGLDRVPGARLVSPKGVPRWWRDADRAIRIGSGGWAVLVSACGLGRASASWALWRMAVGVALFPGSPGGLPHPGVMVAYGCSSCQGGMGADFGRIFGRKAEVGGNARMRAGGWRRDDG